MTAATVMVLADLLDHAESVKAQDIFNKADQAKVFLVIVVSQVANFLLNAGNVLAQVGLTQSARNVEARAHIRKPIIIPDYKTDLHPES